jgi:DNA (cytosine-5)-methyltransferase 1
MMNTYYKQKYKPMANATECTASLNSLRFIDLFCGIGGFHQALSRMNAECIFASDIDPHCRRVYEANYKIKPSGDIMQVDIASIPEFDVLCAGFPCQPFSKAGYQKGFDDDRGILFFRICEIVRHHKPKYLLLENVSNLCSHDNGNTWTVIYNEIVKLGYITYETPPKLNVLHFNVPQNRERVVIMCKRRDLGDLDPLPEIRKRPSKYLTVGLSEYMCNSPENKKYNLDGKLKMVETVWDEFVLLLRDNHVPMPKFPIWTDWWDNDLDTNPTFYLKYKNWIDKNRVFYNENATLLANWLIRSRSTPDWFGAMRKFEWQAGDLLPTDSMKSVLWTSRGSGIRVKRLDYIPTLVAMSMIPVYGPLSRKLSPRELLRLQSFDDSFAYEEKYIFKQVGNAVNVKMIERCARFLILGEELFRE